MKTPVIKFFSFSCAKCGGIQLGGDDEGNKQIPIFSSRELAQMAIEDWMDEAEREAHPPVIYEFELFRV